jgi:predicted kinase
VMTVRVYERLIGGARTALLGGQTVILDAVYAPPKSAGRCANSPMKWLGK